MKDKENQTVYLQMESIWKIFLYELNSFADYIFDEERNQSIQEEREHL